MTKHTKFETFLEFLARGVGAALTYMLVDVGFTIQKEQHALDDIFKFISPVFALILVEYIIQIRNNTAAIRELLEKNNQKANL